MKIVIALGGNAILKRGEPLGIETQRANIISACDALQAVVEQHDVILTHGNGPQVGLLALQSMADPSTTPYPLDVLGAESEGMIGYLLAQELRNTISHSRIANLMTQTLVDVNDQAFNNPTKFIGPVYTQNEASRLKAKHGWQLRVDGEHYRRVVASPKPKQILELDAIRALLNQRFLVICTGGGGVPVVKSANGSISGVEAVIDKDHASALLARQVDADELIMLTDVDAVYEKWSTPEQARIESITASAMALKQFAAGSMQPKVSAACEFVESTGGVARIGALQDAGDIVHGNKGTTVHTG